MLIGKKQEGQKLQEKKNFWSTSPRRQKLSHGDIFSSTADLSLESGGKCSEQYLLTRYGLINMGLGAT